MGAAGRLGHDLIDDAEAHHVVSGNLHAGRCVLRLRGVAPQDRGGAIAIASANRVLMLEHAIYSVISPEGAASILWRDTAKAQEAATGMKITADDMMRFGVIDQIVTEPPGGAHRDPAAAIASTGEAIANALEELAGLDRETVRRQRREKFLAIGRTWG